MNHSTLRDLHSGGRNAERHPGSKNGWAAHSPISATRIQQLEEELAVELFVRGNKKMVLSPAGAVSQLCPADPRAWRKRQSRLCIRQPQAASLRLGAMEATAASGCRRCLPASNSSAHRVDITLITQPTRQLTEGVLTRRP